MNKRLKELRKILNLNQREFGKTVGITDTAISKIEKGERNMSNQLFLSICREFNVNEIWLQTGEGEIFNEVSKENKISKWVNSILKDRPDNFKKRLLMVLSTLNENDWEFLEQKAKELLSIKTDEIPASKNSNNELSTTKEMSLKPAYEMTDKEIDEEVETYRQQLILEKKQAEKSSALRKDELA